MAVLSKAGCNAGACHGNRSGKGGFKLSLRGEDPARDFLALSREFYGRRLNPTDPDQSLILLKPTTQLPHEGGLRFSRDSIEYAILRDWISGGMPDDPQSARVTSIEVTPAEKILVESEKSVDLTVKARFTDGTEQDVTRLAVYEPVESYVRVTPEGRAEKVANGEATVLVRYLEGQKATRLAFIPARADFRWPDLPANSYVDEHIFAKCRQLRLEPSEICSDGVYLRRLSLDLLGLLPTRDEIERFVKDGRPEKRALLARELLQRPEFNDFWALKWADLLRNEEKVLDRKGVQNFHHWIRQSLERRQGLDQFVRELIAARGSTYDHPAANYYRAHRTATSRAEAAAQLFLGTRLQCAQCHNHPFDRWTQDDYYNWSALFAGVNYKILENRRRDGIDGHEFVGEQIIYLNPAAKVTNPRTGQPAVGRLLGSAPAQVAGAQKEDLADLAEWVVSQPLFARAQANRIWYHLFGRGLVEPIDDFRATNPPSHPALLEQLAADFAAHRFDVRYLIELLATSTTYQLSSVPNENNREDAINFSHAIVRRLTAEQLVDCQNEVLDTRSRFNGYPPGLRAAQLPGVEAVQPRDQKPSGSDQFLNLFGKPQRLLTCECERSNDITMNQAFQLISGPGLHELLTRKENRLTTLLASSRSSAEMIEELYWAALGRPPAPGEISRATSAMARAGNSRAGLEDVAWALLNAKEFLLRQ